MRKIVIILMLVCLTTLQQWGDSGLASAKSSPEGPWRIAYIEGGSYSGYWRVLQGLAQELERQGLIRNGAVPLPASNQGTRLMWDWLVDNAGGDKVVFMKDGFYSASWDEKKRYQVADALATRIRDKQDVDAVLAFGTWGGQDMSKLDTDVPVIVASVTNALESGIISSVEDSGRDNLTAAIDPERYMQQVTLFHDIFRFKKMGIVYEDTPSGRSSIALGSIEKEAATLGVELVRCTDQFDIPDISLAAKRLRACHQKLADAKVDAVFVTVNTGMQPGLVDDVLEPLVGVGIPTFSQAGSHEVEEGVLLSISQASFGQEGAFSGKALAEIIKGKLPRDLLQRMEAPVSLSMNLRMATLIGWNPSLEILAAIDEIYRSMDGGQVLE